MVWLLQVSNEKKKEPLVAWFRVYIGDEILPRFFVGDDFINHPRYFMIWVIYLHWMKNGHIQGEM